MDPDQKQDDTPPAAGALAMGAAGHDGKTAAQAREYLREQTKLTRLQIEDMARKDRLRLWSFRVRHVSDVAVWSAANDNALVIEAFNVPPEMAQRGLTGQVVAIQLQDKLSNLQAQTNSMRAASSYENNWGNDIKVQIPETGVSIGDIGRYLRDWLGSEAHITGEIFRDGGTVSVTVRVGADAAKKFSGKESDLDTLMQKAAEAVYGETQPYRYGVYLSTQNRLKEIAHDKGPHWADPLEYWGEALLWSGSKQAAQKQFSIAAKLALTPQEKAELASITGARTARH